MRRTRLFLLGLVLVSLVEAARQWNSAPGRVPSHFDAAGRPNAWASRDEFFMLQIGVTLGIAALFIGIPPAPEVHADEPDQPSEQELLACAGAA
jgi:uncharacterized membrane protein